MASIAVAFVAVLLANPQLLWSKEPPPEGAVTVVGIERMTCPGCEVRVEAALRGALPGAVLRVSYEEQSACVDGLPSLGEAEHAAIAKALEAAGFGVSAVEEGKPCPVPRRREVPGPWTHRGEGLDVRIVSSGGRFDVRAQLVAGKYTVVDFGAAWCSPCHKAAETLAAYLGEHGDTAVRAVDLVGADPEASYALPVAEQYLQYAPGLPWIVVHSPRGKVLYRGMSVDKALDAVDNHRARRVKKK